MSIGMAMLSAFILVCACSLFAGLIYGLIWILIDHPRGTWRSPFLAALGWRYMDINSLEVIA